MSDGTGLSVAERLAGGCKGHWKSEDIQATCLVAIMPRQGGSLTRCGTCDPQHGKNVLIEGSFKLEAL